MLKQVIVVEGKSDIQRIAQTVEADCIAVQKDEDLNIDVDGLIETCNRNGAKLVIFSKKFL